MTNTFISWSGDQSKEIAEELRNWIPSVIQSAKPYFTPNDIEKGSKWSDEISKKLSESNVGIICLTKENLNKPWILFEAGALSKDLERSKVCSILFGIDNTDVTGPLTTFQATDFDKADFKKMMLTINDASGETKLAKETFDRVFEMWWPQLKTKVDEILKREHPVKETETRSDREILEEILEISRIELKRMTRIKPSRGLTIPPGLVEDFLDAIERTSEYRFDSDKLSKALQDQIALVEFISQINDTYEEFRNRIEATKESIKHNHLLS